MNSTMHPGRLPHLLVDPQDLSAYTVVVGDMKRVRQAATLMSDVEEIGNNREYLTITGTHKGRRITIVSHGIGAGGANVCFMELLRGGVHTLIRAGTCGALSPEIDDGDLIIATGAVREDATTEQLMPVGYPAIADRQILGALIEEASQHGYPNPHIGLAVTHANFYASPVLPSPYKKYVGFGVKALEMELAGLLVLALMSGARAGGILASDGNLVREGSSTSGTPDFNPYRDIVRKGVMMMLEIALDALVRVARKDEMDLHLVDQK